ncbi:MAG: putative insertion element transposase [Sphaerisporangium sp.]|jgi:hypothetical protein|nr:putative insertion element transposase [Sphaerisporangium sp.]
MITSRGSGRSDGRPVGGSGTVAAEGREAWSAAGSHQAAADQRDTVPHADRCPVADLPARYGPWETVYGLFRRWQRDGTWHHVFAQLQARADAKGLITWDISVDSTVCRAPQHAAGARRSSTRPTTRRATPWNAGSIGSSATAQWRPDTTSSPSATRPPRWSQQSTSGYDQHFRNTP